MHKEWIKNSAEDGVRTTARCSISTESNKESIGVTLISLFLAAMLFEKMAKH